MTLSKVFTSRQVCVCTKMAFTPGNLSPYHSEFLVTFIILLLLSQGFLTLKPFFLQFDTMLMNEYLANEQP